MPRKILIVIVGACFIAIVALIASNPFRLSEADIKRQILEITPLGTSFSQVRTTIKQHGWRGDISGGTDANIIEGFIGSYRGFHHRRNFFVMWLFRGIGKTNLTDVFVTKSAGGQ